MQSNNKTIIITGANRGLGKQTALELARMGATIYLACRSVEQGTKAQQEITAETGNKNLFVRALDLADFSSIRKFAEEFMAESGKLDVLINNAGMWTKQRNVTAIGAEETFAVNVVGHQLLTSLLVPALAAAAPSRIVNVASHYAGGLDLDDINFERRFYKEVAAYQQTKQANRMLTREWAKELQEKNISVYSMTPGFVPETDLFREQMFGARIVFGIMKYFGARTIKQGADTTVWLASAETITGSNGGFFRDRKEVPCEFNNAADEKKLWDICEGYIKQN